MKDLTKFRTFFFSAVLLLFLFNGNYLAGQTVNTDSLANEQIKQITETLKRDRAKARFWWDGWLTAYSAATVGQGVVYFTSEDKNLRQDMALGAATTLLGAAGVLIAPIEPRVSREEKKILNDENGIAQPEKMKLYEDWLKEIAIREKAGRSWKTHALSGAVNLGSGLITWLGFKRTIWDGLENFALNTAITEAQIWTQPTRAIKDYKKYCEQYYPGTGIAPSKPEPAYYFGAYPGGVTFRIVF